MNVAHVMRGRRGKPPARFATWDGRKSETGGRAPIACDCLILSQPPKPRPPAGIPKMGQITTVFDGLRWFDPTASTAAVAGTLLPPGDDLIGSKFPCRITTERRRVRDLATGRRKTRDWRIAHFVLWRDGDGAVDLGRLEAEAVLDAAGAASVDQIVVHGKRALYSGPSFEFLQFGVRELSTIPSDRH